MYKVMSIYGIPSEKGTYGSQLLISQTLIIQSSGQEEYLMIIKG